MCEGQHVAAAGAQHVETPLQQEAPSDAAGGEIEEDIKRNPLREEGVVGNEGGIGV
jgi:hypothetical protein